MGKRSRKAAGRPAPKPAAARADGPTGTVERAKVSWKAAADAGPKAIHEPGRRPRVVMSPNKPRFDAKNPREKGDRPAALWGKAPISEFAILVGTVLFLIGLAQGPNAVAIPVGLVMISIAALEFAGREHLRGYRSHSLFLAMIIVILLHFGLAYAIGASNARSPAFIAMDVVVFGVLATALHKQFSIARLQAAPKRSR